MLKNTILLLLFFCTFNVVLGQQIDIITQEKIQGVINILAYSPNGNLIASGGAKENSIKIWDINSGKIIGKLEGHLGSTNAITFNEEGTLLVSSANDRKIIVWDLINWQLKDSITVESAVTAISLSKSNAANFYIGMENGAVQQRAFDNLQQNNTLFSAEDAITSIDNTLTNIAVGTKNGYAHIYNITEKRLRISEKIQFGAIIGLNFSRDNQKVIGAGANGKIQFWNVNDLEESTSFNAFTMGISSYSVNIKKELIVAAGNNKSIKMWDFDGQLIKEFKRDDQTFSDQIEAISISPDGGTIASSGFQNIPGSLKKENVIQLWDLNRGTLLKTLAGQVNPIYTFDFHPTENRLVSLGEDNVLTFWNFNLAEKYGEITLPNPKREIGGLVRPKDKTEDGNVLADANGKFKKLKKTKNMLDRIKTGDFSGLSEETKDIGKNIGVGLTKRLFKERPIVKYSSKGNYLITKLRGDELRLYSIENNEPSYKAPLYSYQGAINSFQSSPNEKYLVVVGSGDSAISIIDIEKQEFIKKLNTAAPSGNFQYVYEANSIAFSPDGTLMAVCFNTGKTFVYSTQNWQLVFENILVDNLGYVESPFVNFTEDGNYMAVKSMLGIVKYDTKTFDILNSEKLKVNGYSVSLDRSSNYAVTISEDMLYFENLLTGKVNKSIKLNPKELTNISVKADGNVGITFTNGQFILIDPTNGEEIVLLVANGDNYIFKTAENYYKVSKEGYDLVTFRIGNNAFPFEQFDAVFNRPDLVLKKLRCQDQELIALYKQAYEKRIKKLGLSPKTEIVLADIPNTEILNQGEIPATSEKTELELSFKTTDRTALNTYNIWINNVPVYGKTGKKISGKSKTITERIALVHGLNKIQISCQNSKGFESLIQTFYIEKTGTTPSRDLYLVTIGTADYKDTRYNLSYPVKDGQDLTDLLSQNTKGIYNTIKVKQLYNEAVTNENVLALKPFLNEAKPDDVIMVFVAGHGVLDANFDYYFGTYNIDFSNPQKNGLAYAKLEQLLDGVKANKKILIMDTCHSGEVDKDDVFFASSDLEKEENQEDISFRSVGEAVKEDESKASPSRLAGELFNDLRKGTGSTVISSAGGVEFAMESAEWKNGLFTYCLLNGLKNRTADLDGDGVIMLLELQAYVVDKVKALSHGKQVPNSRIQNLELDFPIW